MFQTANVSIIPWCASMLIIRQLGLHPQFMEEPLTEDSPLQFFDGESGLGVFIWLQHLTATGLVTSATFRHVQVGLDYT